MMGESAAIMGPLAVWHWITFALLAALVLYPIGRILARIGFSPLWSIVAFIPLTNLFGLWAIAPAPWSGDKEESP